MLGQWLIFLHVISAFALVAGLVGREMTRVYARGQDQVDVFTRFIDLSSWFENKLVRPASLLILIFGLLAAWARGWPLLGGLQGSNWLFLSLLLFLSIIPVIAFIFVPRGKIFDQRLADARAQGVMTAALRASIDDPVVRIAHIYEAAAVAVVIYLMVMKPF